MNKFGKKFGIIFEYVGMLDGVTREDLIFFMEESLGWTNTYATQRFTFFASVGLIVLCTDRLYRLNLEDLKECINNIESKASC